jgi:hypothetical protein
MTNAIKVLLQMQSGFLQLDSTLLIAFAIHAREKSWLHTLDTYFNLTFIVNN